MISEILLLLRLSGLSILMCKTLGITKARIVKYPCLVYQHDYSHDAYYEVEDGAGVLHLFS